MRFHYSLFTVWDGRVCCVCILVCVAKMFFEFFTLFSIFYRNKFFPKRRWLLNFFGYSNDNQGAWIMNQAKIQRISFQLPCSHIIRAKSIWTPWRWLAQSNVLNIWRLRWIHMMSSLLPLCLDLDTFGPDNRFLDKSNRKNDTQFTWCSSHVDCVDYLACIQFDMNIQHVCKILNKMSNHISDNHMDSIADWI